MKTLRLFVLGFLLAGALQASENRPRIEATDLEALRSAAGTEAIVSGAVVQVGTTQDGGITFLNIGMPKKQGFVAVIFRDNYSSFPEGFSKFLNQKVNVSGVVELYRNEQPQIVLRSPEQIEIVTE